MRRMLAHAGYYPWLLWNHVRWKLDPKRPHWDAIDEVVIMGKMPLLRHVPALATLGVRGVVNMCEEYPGPLAAYREAAIEQLHLPTIDFTIPSYEDLVRGAAFIRAHAERGERVYVHCKAGRGRSATLVLCWLIERHGIEPEEAQRRLRAIRPKIVDGLWRREPVQRYASVIRSGAGSR